MALAAFGIAPMKAVASDSAPTGEGWAYEPKWDGYRTLAFVNRGRLRLQSTRLRDVTTRWPELAGLADAVHGPAAVLDGEVVVVGPDGRPSFERLARGEGPATYVVFDVLSIGGIETVELPYRDRRRLLEQLLDPGPNWRVTPSQVGDGDALVEATRSLGVEGVIAKRLDSSYLPGKRSAAWRKIKHRNVQEFVVGGWLPGRGPQGIGSLLVGHHGSGGRLQWCGAVGSGLDDATARRLRPLLEHATQTDSPFDPTPEVAGAPRWCHPELVVQVAFAEWTAEGRLRHPVLLGVRDDVDPAQVVRES
jgi:bifunctional non-homologous end joining protein LigD